MATVWRRRTFHKLHDAMKRYVDDSFLPGVALAVLIGDQVADVFCYGFADIEAGTTVTDRHLFRIFSNTKLLTTCAVLMLHEDGHLRLQDRIDSFLPELSSLRVLCPDAKKPSDVGPLRTPITVYHLLTHTAGLSYGLFNPKALLYSLYKDAEILSPRLTLQQFVGRLSYLPLAFQPGSSWEYSIAPDVLARLVEVISGKPFGAFLVDRILEPLGMSDTKFVVSEEDRARICALYIGAEVLNPLVPGLRRRNDKPYPDAFLRPVPRESGSTGLVSSLTDHIKLFRALSQRRNALLRESSLDLMCQRHLPEGISVTLPHLPHRVGRSFGLGAAYITRPCSAESLFSAGELSWGGFAGTVWLHHRRLGISGVLLTQRYMAFDNPYSFDFKREVYEAIGF